MLLGLKAQKSISQGFSVEMKQIAVKQLDLLRHVATGFQDQTDHLQQISDDIGANLNALAQGFVKLGDALKDLHARARVDGQEIENRHKQLLDKLESQNVYYGHICTWVNKLNDNMKNLCWSVEELRPGGANGKSGETTAKAGSLLATINKNLGDWIEDLSTNLASMTNEIQKSLSSLETSMKEGLERKRPLEGPPPSEAKKVKFQHAVTKEEHIGTEKERDQKMAQWWGEIAASSAASGINPAGSPPQPQRLIQMMGLQMMEPMGTPVTPIHVPIDSSSGFRLATFMVLLLRGRCQQRPC
eukprot:symbB.v1.2.041003.t1/scaffold7731.1/size9665/1